MDRKQLSKRRTVYLRVLTTGLTDGDRWPGEAASRRWFQLPGSSCGFNGSAQH